MRQARLSHKEVFVPLTHPPRDAQADFGEALVVVGGAGQKGHVLCVDLPHSDDSFVVAFPAENTESFREGHNQAFAHFGGVPQTILYDNTKIAVKQIAGDGERDPDRARSPATPTGAGRSRRVEQRGPARDFLAQGNLDALD